MKIVLRRAAVAGKFYPSDPVELRSTLDSFASDAPRRRAFGIVVPHAGYIYSGPVAGSVYSRIECPARAIVMCPNHTGRGVAISVMTSGGWETPLGTVEIDEQLAHAVLAADSAAESDSEAHRFEHALEVQLPFLQRIAPANFKFVPITIGTGRFADLEHLGHALASVIDDDVLLIASSDMNHYEDDRVTRSKDRRALNRILAFDTPGLFSVLKRENVTMCGYGPVIAMLTAALDRGVTHAELVRYATSGDVSGDFERVVGYAGVIVQ